MRPQDFGLRDRFPHGAFHCTCGDDLYPDCDVSAASVAQEFERHLIEEHGFTIEQIEAALRG
jgi:hypothetical protein